MREISAGAALGAGFGLIRREPAAFLAWCALYFVIGVLPQGLALSAMGPLMQAAKAGAGANSQAFLDAQAQMARLQPISLVAGLLVMTLIPSAVFRAVLYPDDRRFLYLRLGMREVWMSLSAIVIIFIWVLAMFAAMLPTIIGGLIAARAGGGAGAALLAILLFFVLTGVATWAVLRLSPAPVMSFADRTFRLPEAWTLSRGHALRLFLVGLALLVFNLVVEALVLGVGFGLLAATTPDVGKVLQTHPETIFTRLAAPQMVLVGAVLALFGGWIYVMWAAAWASMFRDLTFHEHDVFS